MPAMPIDKLVLLGLAAAGAATFFAWCATQERRDRGVVVVALIFVLVVVEAVLWPNQQDVPNGLFNFGIGGYSVRLPEILIPLALGARVAATGAPRRIGWPAFWLGLFLLWYGTAGVMGLIEGYAMNEVLFEAKAIVYVGGGFALAAGVPALRYFDTRALQWIVLPTAALAVLLIFTSQRNQFIELPIPGARAPRFGEIGADAASVFVALGLFALTIELTHKPLRLSMVAASSLLVIASLFAEQRAAIVGLAASVVVLGIAWSASAGRRRFRVTPTELALAGMIVVGVVLLPGVVDAIAGSPEETRLPLADTVDSTFFGEGNRQSADQRVGQLDAVKEVFRDRPVTGFGLGRQITFFASGLGRWETIALSHNIYTDLLMRAGMVGLLLFSIPAVMLLADARRTWRSASDGRVAVIALTAGAIAVGLLAKGGVESILEKVRLAVLLGFLFGMARSAAVARDTTPSFDDELGRVPVLTHQ